MTKEKKTEKKNKLVEYLGKEKMESLAHAEVLVKSGLLPEGIDTKEKAFLVMQQGKELALNPMQALGGIYVVKGKTALTTNLMASLLVKNGVIFEPVEWNSKKCTLRFTREGREIEVSYTIEEAKQAGYTSKYNWQNMPKEMLKARALSRGARIIAPDIIQGMYTEDELRDNLASTTSTGQVIEGTPISESSTSQKGELYTELKKEIKEADGRSESRLMRNLKNIKKQGLLPEPELMELEDLFIDKFSETNNEESEKSSKDSK